MNDTTEVVARVREVVEGHRPLGAARRGDLRTLLDREAPDA